LHIINGAGLPHAEGTDRRHPVMAHSRKAFFEDPNALNTYTGVSLIMNYDEYFSD
jgi:hypothetical protein